MAKSYSIVERTTPPANVTATKIPGGSLAASTTYYYRIVVNLAAASGYYFTESALSVPSVEVSAATDGSNKAMSLYFDNNVSIPAATCHFMVYRSKVSGDYRQTDRTGTWQKCLVPVTGNTYTMAYGLPSNNANAFKVYTFTTPAPVTVLVVGETLTQQVSGATAIVVSDPAGGTTFKVRSITGTCNATNLFDGSVSGVGLGQWSSTSAQVGWCILDTIADASCYSCPLFEDGLPTIWVNGGTEVDPITPQDLYAWLVSAGKTYCISVLPVFFTGDWSDSAGNDVCQVFQWRFHLMNTASTETHLKIAEGVVVQHVAGKLFFDASGYIYFGELNSNIPQYGGVYVCNRLSSLYSGCYGVLKSYSSFVGERYGAITNNSISSNDPWFQATTTSQYTVMDSVIRSQGRWLNMTPSRSRISPSLPECSAIDGEWVGIESGLKNLYYYRETEFKGIKLLPSYAYDLISQNYSEADILFVIHFVNSVFPDATPFVRFVSAYNPCDACILEEFDLALVVEDERGTAIVGAVIEIKDTNGNNCIFEATAIDVTTKMQKAGTSMGVTGGSPTLGKQYRCGVEVVSVDSGAGPYTVTRAIRTVNHNIGNTSSFRNKLYELKENVVSDGSGEVTVRLTTRSWLLTDAAALYTDYGSPTLYTPFAVKVTKTGYETKVFSLTPTAEGELRIVMKNRREV